MSESWGTITESDALLLGRRQFEKVWRTLGVVAYTRAVHNFVVQHDLPPLAESVLRHYGESPDAVRRFLGAS